MQVARAIVVTLTIVGIVAGSACAQDGATIMFANERADVYAGTWGERAEATMELPVTVGNFRITDIRLPGKCERNTVGQVVPFRHASGERMVDLDPRWDLQSPLALVCEVIDPSRPIGFRIRAHARMRMFHNSGQWLQLLLAESPDGDGAIHAMDRTKRFTWDMQHWYVLSSLQEIYGSDAGAENTFTILIDNGTGGSWWLKWLEIKAWPTGVGR